MIPPCERLVMSTPFGLPVHGSSELKGEVVDMLRVDIRFVFVATLVFMLAVPAMAKAGGFDTPADACQTAWYGSAEALWLQLDHGADGNMPVILDSTNAATLLGTSDLTYSMEPGTRLVLGRRVGETAAVELLYFGLNDWDASRTVAGNNDLRIPGDLALQTLDFFNADALTASQSSTIDNVEVNLWRRNNGSPLELMAGFRYVNFDERFQISATDSDTGASRYRVNTQNDLFGGQLGGRFRFSLDQQSRFGLEATTKAGVFGNAVGMQQFVSDSNNTFVLRNTDVSAGRAAFVGDVGLAALLRVTDSITARVGYTLIWVEGVARAANQLDFTDTTASGTTLAYGQGAFLQGVSLGLEVGW